MDRFENDQVVGYCDDERLDAQQVARATAFAPVESGDNLQEEETPLTMIGTRPIVGLRDSDGALPREHR